MGGDGRPQDGLIDRTGTVDREHIRDLLKGTHDIARAAELLHAEGTIAYWQPKSEKIPEDKELRGTLRGSGALARGATRMNCFEFVHLLNELTCCRDLPPNFGRNNTEEELLDVRSGFTEWDGASPIPRGSVIVATAPAPAFGFGDSKKGIFHVGVAVGEGKVISNVSESSVTKDPINDCFSVVRYKVYYGPYPHCECHESREEHRGHGSPHSAAPSPLGVTGPLHELPSVAVQNASRVGRPLVTIVLAGGLLAAAGGLAGAALSGAFGTRPPEPTPLPILARVTATPPATSPPTPAPTATTAPVTVGSPSFVSFRNDLVVGVITGFGAPPPGSHGDHSTRFTVAATGQDLVHIWRLDGASCGALQGAALRGPTVTWPHADCATLESAARITVTVARAADLGADGLPRAGSRYFVYSQTARAGDSTQTDGLAKDAKLENFGP